MTENTLYGVDVSKKTEVRKAIAQRLKIIASRQGRKNALYPAAYEKLIQKTEEQIQDLQARLAGYRLQITRLPAAKQAIDDGVAVAELEIAELRKHLPQSKEQKLISALQAAGCTAQQFQDLLDSWEALQDEQETTTE